MQNRSAAADFAQFAREVAVDGGASDTVERILTQARQALHSDHAGITIRRSGGKLTIVAATDPVVVEVAQLQFHLTEGPCIDAVTAQRLVYSPDVAAHQRWPRWGPQAANLGVRSILSAQLYTPHRNLGALNLYAEQPGRFDAEAAAIADVFSAHAAAALAAAKETENLHTAVANRTVIGQAQGLLMARYHLNAEQAFAVLRRHSQDGNQKLHVIAELIVADHERPKADMPGPVQAAQAASARAAELEQRLIELQNRTHVTPADVAAAQQAVNLAKERAAAASERHAERRMRATMTADQRIAAAHTAIANLYHHPADIDPSHRGDRQHHATEHETTARQHHIHPCGDATTVDE